MLEPAALNLSSRGNTLNVSTDLELASDFSPDSPNSLFDSTDEASPSARMVPAMLHAPPIPGLFFFPSILVPIEFADQVMRFCLDTYFPPSRPGVNQIMLFGTESIPLILHSLLSTMSSLLKPSLPPTIHTLLFPDTPTRERQVILNLYHPGEGITPHVDLLKRYDDGIVGVSFGSSCAMQFARVEQEESSSPMQLFLPERSMIVLSGEARYDWTHGIDKRAVDLVSDSESEWIVERGVRMSVTFRWLLPGANIVGDP
ncbi:hypothetical protein DFH08DRAFT_888608 [Mycena albidolilacea]|uniref:Fe2OG dioxygenase domain-containing protein n=1 Tax=Mycena albidolilacea TaxID=1033008 RepID=A0AAD6ZH83_9AGAR|nr:hypothetical protein DFH08DRAFT_888608 [Mycena albidolilacea]